MSVNPVTNKVYVANQNSTNVTIIDATNNTTQTVAAGTVPTAVAANPVTSKIYVTNNSSSNVTVITPAPTSAIPLNTVITPLAGNTTSFDNPHFSVTATSTYSPNAPPPQNIYFQMDTANGTWTKAINTGSTATTRTAQAQPFGLQAGVHIIYFFATDGSDATSINPFVGDPLAKKNKISLDAFAPESSPVIGGINAYLFRVGFAPTAANVSLSGRVLTSNGSGLRNAAVMLTDQIGITRTAFTSSFGYYRFDDVATGQSYTVGVNSKRFQFVPQLISVSDALTGVDFVADSGDLVKQSR